MLYTNESEIHSFHIYPFAGPLILQAGRAWSPASCKKVTQNFWQCPVIHDVHVPGVLKEIHSEVSKASGCCDNRDPSSWERQNKSICSIKVLNNVQHLSAEVWKDQNTGELSYTVLVIPHGLLQPEYCISKLCFYFFLMYQVIAFPGLCFSPKKKPTQNPKRKTYREKKYPWNDILFIFSLIS